MTRIKGARFALAAVLAGSVAAGCGGGKTLKVGQPAKVVDDDSRATFELTPKSIEKKSIADLAGLNLEPSQKSSTPYFVTYSCKNVGSAIPKEASSGCNVYAIDDEGEELSSVTVLFGDFKPCEEAAPRPLKKGETLDKCSVFLVPESGGEVKKLKWLGDPDKTVEWEP